MSSELYGCRVGSTGGGGWGGYRCRVGARGGGRWGGYRSRITLVKSENYLEIETSLTMTAASCTGFNHVFRRYSGRPSL